MNEKSFEYLKNQIKFTGFGESLENDLREKMQQGLSEFTLFHQANFGTDSTVATLHFKKSDESDLYFFNRYSLLLKNEKSDEVARQTFYISNKENNISLKEAYNLMSGRSVYKELSNKEGQKYNAWLQMDFRQTDKNGNYKLKQYHQNYGYDLEKVLGKYPVKELHSEENKQRLLQSLQRGNRQSVTFSLPDKELKVFIEASPQYKSLNLYETNGRRIKSQQLEENSQNQSLKQETPKQTTKQAKSIKEDQGLKQNGKSKKNKQSIS